SDRVGQPPPRHVTVTRAPGGAWAVIKLRFTPDEVRTPAMWTTGKGAMRLSGRRITWSVPLATLERPSAAVTSSRTTWSPGVVNEVLRTCLPTLNTPLLARAQANVVSGLVRSVELDTSETVSPTTGVDGNHLNDASGGAD